MVISLEQLDIVCIWSCRCHCCLEPCCLLPCYNPEWFFPFWDHLMQLVLENTHTHPFNGPLSGTTRVSQNQKGTTNLDFTEARDSEWQWHQLGHMQLASLHFQTDNHASTPPLSVFTSRTPFLPPNQQRQSTEVLEKRLLNGLLLLLI